MIWIKRSKLLLLLLCCSLACRAANTDRKYLESNFRTPPAYSKPAIYWYWMNEHVSKEGITKDLEAMLRVGIGEVFIGNIYEGGVPGKVETMSSEWLECMRHAIKEGTRLGVDVSLFNAPGWSQSGGPWVKPEQSMRYLSYVSTTVKGGSVIRETLTPSNPNFQDVALLAYPKRNDTPVKPERVKISCEVNDTNNLFDGDLHTKCLFKNNKRDSIVVDILLQNPFTARSLVISPTGIGFNTTCKLLKKKEGEWKMIKQLFFDRSNTSLQLGPTPDGPMVMTFPDETSTEYRIVLTDLPANFELKEMALTTAVKLEKYTEKWLNKLPNTSNPKWNAYVWNSEGLSSQVDFISDKEVVDLTSFMKKDVLTWDAPHGEWNIIRIGMVPTGTTNVPAAPKARGLEIDKMKKEACQAHFDAFVGHIMQGLTKEEAKSLKKIIVDSYEVGPQNWTDHFRQVFKSSMGYDPIPWLPVLAGDIIGSEEQSNRFLWDMRRTIANQVAEQYVGGFREVAHEHGLSLWLENYGHWGYPSEFLYYGSFSDYVGGEFWAGSGPSSECKLASSSCHIYGKNKVYAESYTAGGRHFQWNPKELKQKGDWSYTQGVNQVVMHVYIHQPYEDKTPGVNAWFGIEYNRKNTWFEQSKSWIDYQRRCSFMLQQGLPINDVCIFIGEDSPSMDGWVDQSLSSGYSFDFINADVILNRLSVKNGRLCLPNGIEYAAMLLPPLSTMRPEVLKKIKELVNAGAVVVGNPPKKSPSLTNYPVSDQEVKTIARELWGTLDVENAQSIAREVGKGMIYCNIRVNDVLKRHQIIEDVATTEKALLWTHRKLKNGDVYFLTNQGKVPIQTNVEFRVKNKLPELWNALDGTTRKLNSYQSKEGSTIVPISLNENESCFVLFMANNQKKSSLLNLDENYPEDEVVNTLCRPWQIQFQNESLQQNFKITTDTLFDWSTSSDNRVKYFSGKATYHTQFTVSNENTKEALYLVLDAIHVIGSIRVNDKEVATLWTKPYRADITPYVKAGENKLEITVSNTWANQLVYQSNKPINERSTWTLLDIMKPNQQLLPSGIVGNVSIVREK